MARVIHTRDNPTTDLGLWHQHWASLYNNCCMCPISWNQLFTTWLSTVYSATDHTMCVHTPGLKRCNFNNPQSRDGKYWWKTWTGHWQQQLNELVEEFQQILEKNPLWLLALSKGTLQQVWACQTEDDRTLQHQQIWPHQPDGSEDHECRRHRCHHKLVIAINTFLVDLALKICRPRTESCSSTIKRPLPGNKQNLLQDLIHILLFISSLINVTKDLSGWSFTVHVFVRCFVSVVCNLWSHGVGNNIHIGPSAHSSSSNTVLDNYIQITGIRRCIKYP